MIHFSMFGSPLRNSRALNRCNGTKASKEAKAMKTGNSIAIIGAGFVGQAMLKLFGECDSDELAGRACYLLNEFL